MAQEIYTKEEIDNLLKEYVKIDGSTPITGEQTFKEGLITERINSDNKVIITSASGIGLSAPSVSSVAENFNVKSKINFKVSEEATVTLDASQATENREITFPDASGELDLSNS